LLTNKQANKQTNKQTDKHGLKHILRGGGNYNNSHNDYSHEKECWYTKYEYTSNTSTLTTAVASAAITTIQCMVPLR